MFSQFVSGGFKNLKPLSARTAIRIYRLQYQCSLGFSTTNKKEVAHVGHSDEGGQKYSKFAYDGPSAEASFVYNSMVFSTERWKQFPLQQKDIVLVSPAKSGSTMTGDLIGQLLHHERTGSFTEKETFMGASPEVNFMDTETVQNLVQMQRGANSDTHDAEAKTAHIGNNNNNNNNNGHKVLWKSHFAVETLFFSPDVKYVFLARDYRDMIWSLYNHYITHSDAIHAQMLDRNDWDINANVFPKWVKHDRETYSVLHFWNDMLSRPDAMGNPDGYLHWSLLWIVGSWWRVQQLPNVKLLHYNQVTQNMRAEITGLLDFLEMERISDAHMDQLLHLCSLDVMRDRWSQHSGAFFDALFEKGTTNFFYKGTNDRWKDVLTADDIQSYRLLAERYMDADAIHWLETGHFN